MSDDGCRLDVSMGGWAGFLSFKNKSCAILSFQESRPRGEETKHAASTPRGPGDDDERIKPVLGEHTELGRNKLRRTMPQQAANVTSPNRRFFNPRHLQPSTNQYDSSRPLADKGRNGCWAIEDQRRGGNISAANAPMPRTPS